MPRRQAVPTIWLMTDERMGDALWTALARLPRGGGIVFRHYATPPAERMRLRARVLAVARRRHLLLVDAGPAAHGGGGVHGRRGRGLVTWPAHDRAEAITGVRAGARLLFISPIYVTRSHPGRPTLGPMRAAELARGLPAIKIALGGVTPMRFRRLRALGFDGWAAIDAWN